MAPDAKGTLYCRAAVHSSMGSPLEPLLWGGFLAHAHCSWGVSDEACWLCRKPKAVPVLHKLGHPPTHMHASQRGFLCVQVLAGGAGR